MGRTMRWCVVIALAALALAPTALAEESSMATADYQEEWGDRGSGALMVVAARQGQLQVQCVSAGLAFRVRHAYMTNRGRKPYEKSSTEPGRFQTTRVAAEYPAMPEACKGQYERVSKAL
jgi:hypothetical protein